MGFCDKLKEILHGKDDDNDKPKPTKNHVRVKGNSIISPGGQKVFLKVATWENPFEGTVSHKTVINFMDTMKGLNLNCILLKANMWMINDDRSPNKNRITGLRNLIKAAEGRGIYTIVNLFDVWSRGMGSNHYNENPNSHPINVWNWGHRFYAADYIKWMTKEYKKYPRVIFELGNEMEKNDWKQFKRIAQLHLLPHFYNIAGKDRPIGVSQQPLWNLPVNVIFNHDPRRMPFVGPQSRPIITNELAYDTDLWKDSSIRDPRRTIEYFNAFKLAKARNHSGVAAATILNINKPLNNAAKNVLKRLGQT